MKLDMFRFLRKETPSQNIARDVEAAQREEDLPPGVSTQSLQAPETSSAVCNPTLFTSNDSSLQNSWSTQLKDAIESRDVQVTEQLLATGESLAGFDWQGQSPLHFCIYTYCEMNDKPLTSNEWEIVNAILVLTKHQGCMERPDSNGHTALYIAIRSGCLDMVEACRRTGANIQDISVKRSTALHIAIKHPHILKHFLDNHDIANSKNDNNEYPIHLSAVYNKVESMKMLLHKFGEDQIRLRCEESTVLHMAVRFDSNEVAEFLVTSKLSDVHLLDKLGHTPLHLAVKNGNESMTKLLLKNGAVLLDKANKRLTTIRQITNRFADKLTFLEGVFDDAIYETTDVNGDMMICIDYNLLTNINDNGASQLTVLNELVRWNLNPLLRHPLTRTLLEIKLKELLPVRVFFFMIVVHLVFLISFNTFVFRFYRTYEYADETNLTNVNCTTSSTVEGTAECYIYWVVILLLYCSICLLLIQEFIRMYALQAHLSAYEGCLKLSGSILAVIATMPLGSPCSGYSPAYHDAAFWALILAWYHAFMSLTQTPNGRFYQFLNAFVFYEVFAKLNLVFIVIYYITSNMMNKASPPHSDFTAIVDHIYKTLSYIQESLGLSEKTNSDLHTGDAMISLVFIIYVIFVMTMWIILTTGITLGKLRERINVSTISNLKQNLDLLSTLDIVVATLGILFKRLLNRRQHLCKIESSIIFLRKWNIHTTKNDNANDNKNQLYYMDNDQTININNIIKRIKQEKVTNKVNNEKRYKLDALYETVVGAQIQKECFKNGDGPELNENTEKATIREKINALEAAVINSNKEMKRNIDVATDLMKEIILTNRKKNVCRRHRLRVKSPKKQN